MAEVTMDLHELDNLRQQISTLQKENEDLKAKQPTILLHHKYFRGTIKGVRNSKIYVTGMTISDGYGINFMSTNKPFTNSRISTNSYDILDVALDINEAINKGLVTINMEEEISKTSSTYINMDDAVQMIREEEYNKVKDTITNLSNQIFQLEEIIRSKDSEIKTKLANEKDTLKKQFEHNYKIMIKDGNDTIKQLKDSLETAEETYLAKIEVLNKEIKDITKTSTEKYKRLKEEYDALKENKEVESKDKLIATLSAKVEALENRGFIERVFNFKS